jgi:NAD(P)H-dependent flavin oxidoreductase YrpB (nitropropane dioxygenase family)
VIRTWLTETLGLQYPIIQAGMGLFDTADLAIDVSSAGALGVASRTLVPIGISPLDWLRENIRKVAARVPLFGVNIPVSTEYVRHKEAGTHEELILKATERDTLVVPGASGGCRVLRTPGPRPSSAGCPRRDGRLIGRMS